MAENSIYDDVALLQEQVAELQEQMVDVQVMVPYELEANTDLNDLDVGIYYIPSTTVSATILNKPVNGTQNAAIVVLNGASGELQQWYFINSKVDSTNNIIYYRYFYSGEWDAWQTGYLRPEDSGWNNLSLASGVSAHNATNFPCRYRKIANRVIVEGCVKGFTDVEKIVATLPAGYRPAKAFYVLTATNGGNTDTFEVRTNGEIARMATTLPSLANTNYHFINFEFLTD